MILQGRCVVVSGANRGLGLAIAEACSKAGASVVMGARDRAELEKAAAQVKALAAPGATVLARALDVADAASTQALAASVSAKFSQVDALVNNAGVYGPMGPLADLDWPAWEEALRINLFGAVHMCRSFLPLLRRSPRGKIINLSGGAATQGMQGLSAYGASKAALVRVTETLAMEEPGLDVNAVAPGALNTRLLDELLQAGPEKVGRAFYEKSLKQRDSGGTDPAVGADMIAWLASAQSDGISGRLLSALWDPWKELPGRLEELKKSDVYMLRRIVPADRGKDWGEPR
jgi:NAD(P)-dependent dehydrogenase (short-subunit alcohol dehydrogenase family)